MTASDTAQSQAMLVRAERVIPGGVNSPVRAFGAVDGKPRFIEKGRGSRLWDLDGNSYIDYVGSWGPMILGHAHPAVVEAVQRVSRDGLGFGACTRLEVELAEFLTECVPSLEQARLVCSGTEATMSAIRLARGFTGRSKIVKVAGGYHGHADFLLVNAGSGATTFGNPDSAGVPPSFASQTHLVPYNDLVAVERLLGQHRQSIAALIIEPVAGNMGVVLPQPEYLDGLRRLTLEHGVLLIFDEVMSGFRRGMGCAQTDYGVSPDLTCLGKVMGGGLPCAAYGGRAEVMRMVAPLGPVYQAGTLAGNPLAVAAGLATLRLLREQDPFAELEERTEQLCRGLQQAADAVGLSACINRYGSMFTLFFQAGPVVDYAGAKRSDNARFSAYHRQMLYSGVYLPPSQFEANFVSTAHSLKDIEDTLAVAAAVFERLASGA